MPEPEDAQVDQSDAEAGRDRPMTAQRLLAELLAGSQRQEHQLAQAVQTIRGDLDMIWERLRSLAAPGSAESPAAESPSAAPIVIDTSASEPPPAAEPEMEIGPPVEAEVAAPPIPCEPEPTREPAPVASLPEPVELPVEPPAPVEAAAPAAPPESPAEVVTIHAEEPSGGRPGLIDSGVDWESILLGRDLAGNAELADYRRPLVAGLFRGDPAETALVGQLLSFRAATPERMPVLLRDVGEAYYRWRPAGGHSGADPMRDALIGWIQAICQTAGVPNTVALVHVGDRFDSKLHNAKQRGGEVADVFGWVVLRENGSVYTKASVAVR